jgi:hypothetical protein
MTDQELLIATLREAGRIIGEYIEPGPRDAVAIASALIRVAMMLPASLASASWPIVGNQSQHCWPPD